MALRKRISMKGLQIICTVPPPILESATYNHKFPVMSLILCLCFVLGCFSQTSEKLPLDGKDFVTFCEASDYVFVQETKDFLTVTCADINNDGWIAILFGI